MCKISWGLGILAVQELNYNPNKTYAWTSQEVQEHSHHFQARPVKQRQKKLPGPDPTHRCEDQWSGYDVSIEQK